MIHDEPDVRLTLQENIHVEYAKGLGDECREMVDFALGVLEDKLGDQLKDKLAHVTVKIGPGLVDGGGEAKAEEGLILLDSDKMVLSLQQSEDFLVQAGYYEPTERTRTLPDRKDRPWSTLAYELVHEFGHMVDFHLPGEPYHRVSADLSPTKYGKKQPHEAFAEIFTYWVFDQESPPEVAQILVGAKND